MERCAQVENLETQANVYIADGYKFTSRVEKLEITKLALSEQYEALTQEVLASRGDRDWLLKFALLKVASLVLEDPQLNDCMVKMVDAAGKVGHRAVIEESRALVVAHIAIDSLPANSGDYEAQFAEAREEFNNLTFPLLHNVARLIKEADVVKKLKVLLDPTSIASSSGAGGGGGTDQGGEPGDEEEDEAEGEHDEDTPLPYFLWFV